MELEKEDNVEQQQSNEKVNTENDDYEEENTIIQKVSLFTCLNQNKVPEITRINFEENDKSFVLRNVMTPTECKKLIEIAETIGFHVAGLALGNEGNIDGTSGYRFNPKVRNNSRVIVDDKILADGLWNRTKDFLPQHYHGDKIVGLNERFRIYKYNKGEKFSPHFDRKYTRPDRSQWTLFSFMIYLNEGFQGGETTFFESRKRVKGNYRNL